MTLKFALHSIHHIPPGAKDPVVQSPGSVFDLAEDNVADMDRLGAVREPTEDELTLYRAAHAPREAPKAAEPAKTPESKEPAKAVEKEAAKPAEKDPVG